MSSGIYKLTFADKSIYIGKSVDMEKRWDQHLKAMRKGTHTSRIQEAYDSHGVPLFDIVIKCHPHHIDILETYFINGYWSPKILNSTRPADIDELGINLIEELPDEAWDLSTFEYIQQWQLALTKVDELKQIIKDSKNATTLSNLLDSNKILAKELDRLKNRGFFARLFNW